MPSAWQFFAVPGLLRQDFQYFGKSRKRLPKSFRVVDMKDAFKEAQPNQSRQVTP
jgi:hypothetical protein